MGLSPEKRREYSRKWYAENRERVLAQRNEWAKNNPDKRRESCRRAQLKSDFGITPEVWDQLFDKQDRKCAICKCEEPRGGRWAVDHCHATSKVRAILCMLCNTAIGKLNDDPNLLRSAAAYLERYL